LLNFSTQGEERDDQNKGLKKANLFRALKKSKGKLIESNIHDQVAFCRGAT